MNQQLWTSRFRMGRTEQRREAASTRTDGHAANASGSADQQVAALIHGSAHNEIELAKFALSKLQDPQARQFAERMIREHTPGCEAMKSIAGNLVADTH